MEVGALHTHTVPDRRLLFVRHAESEKTVQGRVGGSGLPLTAQGIGDARELAAWLTASVGFDGRRCYCASSNGRQVRETCEVLGHGLGVCFEEREELRSISLGALAGLSREEAAKLYPGAADRLDRWRQGKLGVGELNLPGQEDASSFYVRVHAFWKEVLLQRHTDVLVVGTRSIGIAIVNAATSGADRMVPETYLRYRFDPCSVSCVRLCSPKAEVMYLNRTDFLTSAMHHPDI